MKWTAHFRNNYIDHLQEGSGGRPGWLDPWFRFWVDLQSPAPHFWASLVAIIETVIALAVLIGSARKLTYTAALVFSLLIWTTAEGFGGPYMGASADVDERGHHLRPGLRRPAGLLLLPGSLSAVRRLPPRAEDQLVASGRRVGPHPTAPHASQRADEVAPPVLESSRHDTMV